MKRGTKILSVLFAVACVVVSGVVLHVTDQVGGDFYKVRGVVGAPFELNGATVTVQTVSVGRFLSKRGTRTVESAGLFVRVDVEVSCPDPCPDAPDEVILHAGDRTYEAWGIGQLLNPPPGYRTTSPVVFEIDPADLGDLVSEVRHTEVISGYQAHGWIDLRLAGRADQLRHDAADKAVDVGRSETEVIT